MSFEVLTSTVSIFWGLEAYSVSNEWEWEQSGIVFCRHYLLSAALGTMEVSCYLNAFAKTGSNLLLSFTEIWPPLAGRAYWKRATTRPMNICVRPRISSSCLHNWFNRYSRWFMTAITLLIWMLVVRVGVKNTPSSLTWSICSICVIGGEGTYWQRDGRLNTISLVLDVLIKSLLQSANQCIWIYSSSKVVSPLRLYLL